MGASLLPPLMTRRLHEHERGCWLMVDGRRGRWISFDASFFDGRVGEMILDRFGPAGITLFVAFLCACKRNAVQGQIEYGSVPDAMSLMGIPDLELVDARGVEWDLQSFWRALAAHKQCSTRARGRLIQVKSSKWTKWQEGFASQKEAQRKSRSRATKAPDDAPPMPSSSTADTPPELETEYETEYETDTLPAASQTSDARSEADRIVREWWESKSPKPVAKFIGVVKLVERFIEAGHFPPAVAQALHDAPAQTIGAMEFQLNKPGSKQASTAVERSWRNILEDDVDEPRGEASPAHNGYGLAPTRALEART